MLEVNFSEDIGNALMDGKTAYLVTKRIDSQDNIILESLSKKEAAKRANFEAKNKGCLSDGSIVLTSFEKNKNGTFTISEKVY